MWYVIILTTASNISSNFVKQLILLKIRVTFTILITQNQLTLRIPYNHWDGWEILTAVGAHVRASWHFLYWLAHRCQQCWERILKSQCWSAYICSRKWISPARWPNSNSNLSCESSEAFSSQCCRVILEPSYFPEWYFKWWQRIRSFWSPDIGTLSIPRCRSKISCRRLRWPYNLRRNRGALQQKEATICSLQICARDPACCTSSIS